MLIEQIKYTDESGWSRRGEDVNSSADLVYVFGSREKLEQTELINHLYRLYPDSEFIGCSTSGEISGINVIDDSIVATAVKFDRTSVKSAFTTVSNKEDSFNAGKKLASSFDHENLKHLFVLSEGININGDELVNGIKDGLPGNVNVTGGLSGDSDKFEKTVVLTNEKVSDRLVCAVGFYGDRIKIGFGSLGGWDSFGPERLITKSDGNVLYELDDNSALEIYKKYLGDYADGLPATGLLFPLCIRKNLEDEPIVRTLLSVGEDDDSLVFAGNMPEGSYAKFMKANFDRLIDGAVSAASNSISFSSYKFEPEFALLISCVGRKMILKQRVEEEVEGVDEVLGGNSLLAGFYSYGEISPLVNGESCALHNQTMVITAFSEK